MSNISLGAGVRSNLLTLQQNTNAFNTVNTRLSTGRSVNSAVDNPTNYFADVNLKDRASGLRDRLDSMGQSIQRIQAADAGISRVRNVISQMKGVVNDAIGQTDSDQREALGRQFNSLIVQMGELVKDSEYAGSNLLSGLETDSVQFSESFDESKLDVLGFNLQRAGADGDASNFRMDADGNLDAASTSGAVLDGSGGVTGLAAGSGFAMFITTQYTGTGAGAADIAGIKSAGSGGGAHEIDWTGTDYKDDLAVLITDIEEFDNVLKAESGALANNLAVITNREEFTNDMVNTLEEGGDKLVLADLNEEAANLLALQTANQLGTQALSLANQQSQGVLQLLG